MIRDFFLGFIRIHILYHASKEPIYGLWIIEELGRHGYKLSPGTIYPILHGLEKGGYLKVSQGLQSGKMRKYYRITQKGTGALSESKGRIRALIDEVMD